MVGISTADILEHMSVFSFKAVWIFNFVTVKLFNFLAVKHNPIYKSKLLRLYNNSSFNVCGYILKVVLFSICLRHVGTCDYWIMLWGAGVFTSC